MALLNTRHEDEILIVTFEPTHLDDQTTVDQLGTELQQLVGNANDGKILLNVEHVEFMSSVMVGQLFRLNRKCRAQGVRMKICGVAPLIQRVFEIVRLHNFVEILQDEAEGCAAFRNEDSVAPVDRKGPTLEELTERANGGDAQAQFELGRCFENGEGVTQDSVEALRVYRQAADAGNADAQHRVGMAYAYGIDVEQDYDQALIWYAKAAEQGQADAQYAMGMSFRYGISVDEDQQAAAAWYGQAAAQGHKKAQEELEQMAHEKD